MERTIRGTAILNLDGKKVPKLGRCVCPSKTRVISVRNCGLHQNDKKEAEYGYHDEKSMKKADPDEPT